VAPFGGTDARLMTNPFCVAVPGPGGPPALVLDLATSLVALGKVRVALARGEEMADGILIDSAGLPTRDPAVMYREPTGAILPFGLHKGYGLALACELLGGALAGAGTASTVPHDPDRISNGMLSFVVDPARLGPAAGLQREIAAAIAHVKASPPADPAHPVLVAGEPELASRARRLAGGIPVERATWDAIAAAGAGVGVAVDAP
jgi:uncharacterized oxidoreductase